MRINAAIIVLLAINPVYVPLPNQVFIDLGQNSRDSRVAFSGNNYRKWPRNSRRGCGNYMTRKRLRRNRKRIRM